MTTINVIKQDNVLVPSLPEDEEKLLRVKRGEVIKVEFTKPRNQGFHRKFFAMLQVLVDHHEGLVNIDQALVAVKVGINHCTWVAGRENLIPVPESISWAKMDDISFSKFYNDALNHILRCYMPEDWTSQDYERAVNRILGFS